MGLIPFTAWDTKVSAVLRKAISDNSNISRETVVPQINPRPGYVVAVSTNTSNRSKQMQGQGPAGPLLTGP